MTLEIRDKRRLFHGPDDLFDLVSDVRRYPEFIGPITAMRVSKEKRDGPRADLTAQARVRYKFVAESFTTRVLANSEQRTIDVSFVSGPFRTLENNWRFHALSDGSTLVAFHIKAEFKNPVLQMLLDRHSDRAAQALVNRFTDEAGRRYALCGDESLPLADEIDAVG